MKTRIKTGKVSLIVFIAVMAVCVAGVAIWCYAVGYQVKGEFYAEKNSFVNTSVGFVQPIRLFDKIATNLISNFTYNPSADKVYFTIGFGFNSL